MNNIQMSDEERLLVCLCDVGGDERVPEGPLVDIEMCTEHQSLKLESLIARGLMVTVDSLAPKAT